MSKYKFTGIAREVKIRDLFQTSTRKGWITLHQICATEDFGEIKAGTTGGWVESEKNLSQQGDAWVWPDAEVYDDAYVSGNAQICGNAVAYAGAWIHGYAVVKDNAVVAGEANVRDNAIIEGFAVVAGRASVGCDAKIGKSAMILDNVSVTSNAQVRGKAVVRGNAYLTENALVEANNQWLEIVSIGDQDNLTFYRNDKGEIYVASEGLGIGDSIADFLTVVDGWFAGSDIADAYHTACDLAKIQVKTGGV